MNKNKVKSKKREYDTCSITMELERPLLYDEKDSNSKKSEKKVEKNKKKINILKILLIIVFGLMLGFLIWLSSYYAPETEALNNLKSDEKVEVNIDNDFVYFTPKDKNIEKGFIFYPEAKVDAQAYTNICKEIAKSGYKVVVVDMPFNFALFGKNKANEIINKYPEINNWVVGGDSLGGMMASKYVNDHLEKIIGVVFVSSYPLDSYLKEIDMDVLSIWGSKDGVLNFQALIDAKEKLPKKTEYVEIEGANHSQFGDYGFYKGDEDALINKKRQQKEVVDSIVEFIDRLN